MVWGEGVSILHLWSQFLEAYIKQHIPICELCLGLQSMAKMHLSCTVPSPKPMKHIVVYKCSVVWLKIIILGALD